jgi:hypothetical protein
MFYINNFINPKKKTNNKKMAKIGPVDYLDAVHPLNQVLQG